MIDLTPLDVRNKRGDFKRILRGYEPQEVDTFLEIVAERLEMLVRENLQLRERSETLSRQVTSQSGREQAVQEALVTAQELRADITGQAQREADTILREAETEARRLVAEAEAEVRKRIRDAERRLEQGQDALQEMERRRKRFLRAFRQLLDREMDVVEVEEERAPLEDRPIELDLGKGLFSEPEAAAPEAAAPEAGEATSATAEAVDAGPADWLKKVDEAVTGAPSTDADEAAPPPLDAAVDDLAAAYLTDDVGASQGEPEELALPFDGDEGEETEKKSWS